MKKAVLLVSYGAGNPLAHMELKSFENRCRVAFPQWAIRWAFTSDLLRSRLARQKQKSDSVIKALKRLNFEHFSTVVVQPLQMIPGCEYADVCEDVEEAGRQTGNKYIMGEPLLANARAIKDAARGLVGNLPAERLPHEEVVFMGHGARHEACRLYSSLGTELKALDPQVHLGIMSGDPGIEQIVTGLSSPRVWLLPLLSVVGLHALRDMAGPAPDSWKSVIEASGRACIPVLKGVAQSEKVSAIWLDHLACSIEKAGF